MATTATSKGRKLIAPLAGPTLLFPNERSFCDAEPKRAKGRIDNYRVLFDRGHPCQLIHAQYTRELALVHGYDDAGAELPQNQCQHELLGLVRDRDDKPLVTVAGFKLRIDELLEEVGDDAALLRHFIYGSTALARTYPNERAFVEARPERCNPAHDFGFNWREGGYGHRLSYIAESNEVFAVLREHSRRNCRSELLGQVNDIKQLEQLLKPLWRLHGTRNSLARVRGAVASVRDDSPAPRRRPSALAA